MIAPFPWFGGKRHVAEVIWARLGTPKQYVEPFCGSAAVLLAAPEPASLEVIGDVNGFVANFWRCVVHQPDAVASHADYPVSHVDLGARHRWLLDQVPRLASDLHDAEWPGCPKVAGWWLWGQCAWIGSGWCEWDTGQIPHVSDAGRGVQAIGKIPHVSDAGRGVQAIGQIPHVSDAGRSDMLTSGGDAALAALRALARRLGRVRVIHGDWARCLNTHYGADATAIFFDPPYLAFEGLYGRGEASVPVARAVEAWCRENGDSARVALCGHAGDYDLPGWEQVTWERPRLTYGSDKTRAAEAIWFSPSCERPAGVRQIEMFGGDE